MKALWTAPFRPDWLSWPWPMDTTFHEAWSPLDFVDAPKDISLLYANPNAGFVLRGDILERFPELKVVITPSTGETHLDRASLQAEGIAVRSLLDDRGALDEIRASSEFTFLMVLNSLRRIDTALLGDDWVRDEDALRGRELYGKMVGLIGRGRIGKNLEDWLRAFGAGAYWYDPAETELTNVYCPSVEWLFRNCHIVVLCCALNSGTEGLVGAELVRLMRPGAILVNTSRGEVMQDVSSVLANRPDIEFWTDVLAGEASGDILHSPLLGLPNVHVTPHIAGTTVESQEKAAKIALDLTLEWVHHADS